MGFKRRERLEDPVLFELDLDCSDMGGGMVGRIVVAGKGGLKVAGHCSHIWSNCCAESAISDATSQPNQTETQVQIFDNLDRTLYFLCDHRARTVQ